MVHSSLTRALVLLSAAPLAGAIKKPKHEEKLQLPAAAYAPPFDVITRSPLGKVGIANFGDGLLVGPNTVPWLEELKEVKLSEDGVMTTEKHEHNESTVVYLGLNGRCQIQLELKHNATAKATTGRETVVVLPGPMKNLPMRRGKMIAVFPGVRHSVGLLLADDRAALGGSAKNCKVLRTTVATGKYVWPKQHGFVAHEYSELMAEPAHGIVGRNKMAVAKRSFLQHREIPGIYQFSISQLEGGASSRRHHHRTASEIFYNYDGWGCALQTYKKDGKKDLDIPLDKGKFAVIAPGKEFISHNTHDRGGCMNVNIIVGDPYEKRDMSKYVLTQPPTTPHRK